MPSLTHLLPAGWYGLLPSAQLPPGGVRGIRLAGENYVLARDQLGALWGLPARCPHAGADLRKGSISTQGLRCVLHHRLFTDQPRATQHNCAVRGLHLAERWGIIFAQLGNPGYDLPHPEGPLAALTSTLSTRRIAAPLRLAVANAFDADHFGPVHGRTLMQPPQLWEAKPGAIAMRSSIAVRGNTWRDRILRGLGLREFAIETWCWGGGLLFFHHRRVAACTMVSLCPVDSAHTQAIACTVRAHTGPLARLGLLLQHHFIQAFADQDAQALAGSSEGPLHLDPQRDACFMRFLTWFDGLPRA